MRFCWISQVLQVFIRKLDGYKKIFLSLSEVDKALEIRSSAAYQLFKPHLNDVDLAKAKWEYLHYSGQIDNFPEWLRSYNPYLYKKVTCHHTN